MGGIIFIFLLAILIVLLVTPALQLRFGRKPEQPDAASEDGRPHEVVIRRLDDRRPRPETPPGPPESQG